MTAFELTSGAFQNGGTIPPDFTCSGKNESPPLAWSGAPTKTKSLVLVCEDPDSSGGHFIHWILYNIPFNAVALPKGIPKKPVTVDGMRHGMNSYGRMEYGGPCPPPGKPHRYIFRLTALDTELALNAPVTREVLNKAIAGHALDETELMGKFGR